MAYGTSGTQQVGYGSGSATGNNDHALLWSGNAASFIDLNPSGFTKSEAHDISGTQQVGYGVTGGNAHALLWSGSAAGYVDLNPDEFSDSIAYGTNGTQQVGFGYDSVTEKTHALLWSGSAAGFIDLNQFLPDGLDNATAEAIDGYGNIVGYAYDSSDNEHAVLWVIPEPATILFLSLGIVALRRKNRFKTV
jgi:hypothetical protein